MRRGYVDEFMMFFFFLLPVSFCLGDLGKMKWFLICLMPSLGPFRSLTTLAQAQSLELRPD
jgi:hypothetical protein